MIAQFICSWVLDDGAYKPSIGIDYPFDTITDATGQAAANIADSLDPNTVVVEVTGTQAMIDAAAADDDCYLLWVQ